MSRTPPTRAALVAALLLAAAACDRTPTTAVDARLGRAPDARNAAGARGALLARSGPSLAVFADDPATAVITNGTIKLGVNAEGHLNVPSDEVSTGRDPTTYIGLRYLPTNGEATAPGCICEGWGVADAESGVTGYANEASDGGAHNMTVESFFNDGVNAVSTVLIHQLEACDPDIDPTDCMFVEGGEGGGDGSGAGTAALTGWVRRGPAMMRVRHHYHPSPATPNLYEVRVTIINISTQRLGDVRYRRVMDWDIAPNTFSEYVTIGGTAAATNVLQAHDDGFQSANPLAINPPFVFPAASGDFVDVGPGDIGALFDFGFGPVLQGDSVEFLTFYGAAGTESDASAALSAVGAEVFSFGQPDWDGTGDPLVSCSSPSFCVPAGTFGASSGRPATFIFAFKGVGGQELLPPTAHAGGPYGPRNEGQNGTFADGGSTDPDGSIVLRDWNFGDGSPNASGSPVSHVFADNGTYTVTLKVVDDDGLSDTDTRSVLVRNVAPNVYRLKLPTATVNQTRVGASFWAEWFFRDPGLVDNPWTWSINWGDGSSNGGAANAQGEGNGVMTTHTYATPGVKTVVFRVTDKDGASHSRSIPVIVHP